MFCTRCKNPVSSCECGDIEERLENLAQNPMFATDRCSGCLEHPGDCTCEEYKPMIDIPDDDETAREAAEAFLQCPGCERPLSWLDTGYARLGTCERDECGWADCRCRVYDEERFLEVKHVQRELGTEAAARVAAEYKDGVLS